MIFEIDKVKDICLKFSGMHLSQDLNNGITTAFLMA